MKEFDTTQVGGDPNLALSERIVVALASDGLIVDTRSNAAAQKLSTGTAVVSDWGVWAREAIKQKDSSDATKTAD